MWETDSRGDHVEAERRVERWPQLSRRAVIVAQTWVKDMIRHGMWFEGRVSQLHTHNYYSDPVPQLWDLEAFSFFKLMIKNAELGTPSVQFSCSVTSDSLWTHGLQHARSPCPSPTPGVYSDSCPLSWWCHPTISSSVIPFSSSLQSFPASGSFPMSQFFTSDGQSIGVSASASVLPMNIQDWSSLGLTGLIALQSKGLWRVFSRTTVQKHQFFSLFLINMGPSFYVINLLVARVNPASVGMDKDVSMERRHLLG